jgi:NodT family efflux transporter outer membrane factor (OMF) lipoprotein
LLIALVLAGCAVGPDFQRPAGPAGASALPAAQTAAPLEAEGQAQRFDRQADLPADWWKRFGSPQIDALVDQALAHSPGLRSAQASLRASQDSLRAGYGVFFPQIGASLASERQRSAVDLPPPVGHGLTGLGPYNLSTLAASVSYVPDLFGGQRRAVEALGAVADEQGAALHAAYLTLTANVVNAAIARAGYEAQRDATAAVVRKQDEQLRLAQTQYDAGTAAYTPVLALRVQQDANQAALAALDQRIDQSQHLLAQLCGQAPADFAPPPVALERLVLPADLPDTLPATLARHRPDILAAEANLHAASAQIGIATADLFPSLTLGGTAGATDSVLRQVLSAGTRVWSVQASLAGSIFNGGSQWYTRKAAIDQYDAALGQYESTVLTALQQVADTMRALEFDARTLRAQSDALAAAEQNARLVQANFEAGTAGYLDLLNADAQLEQARVARAGAVAQRLQDTVALYAALGGGWWNAGK